MYDEDKKIILIDRGTRVNCFVINGAVNLFFNGNNFAANKFLLVPAENGGRLKINDNNYRGKIQISSSENSIHLINIISLEDYVKGVLAKEMPTGKGNENFEALKALAVCIRTYAVKKLQNGNIYFDLFADTRDQVYGGLDAEYKITNKAVEETKDLILKYEGTIANLYYHSTCGGYTESAENVFTKEPLPYLQSIKDGESPNCKISPRFKWEEKYSKEEIINRLKDYGLLNDDYYSLEDFSVIGRFKSGRVSELEIRVNDENDIEKILVLKGNEIRSILRTSDNKGILWSTMFDVSMNSNSITLTGNGFGHGVGLCQWGAIAMSRNGKNFDEILQHYYPGTQLKKLND
ncbi:MAG: SpoIID/LytB domain-containing protein [Candidatus Bathyarchaeota archaeon]